MMLPQVCNDCTYDHKLCENNPCEYAKANPDKEPDYYERPSDEQMESYKRGYRG